MFKMFCLTLILVSSLEISMGIKVVPGQRLPHADVLEDILSKHLGNRSYFDDAVLDIILRKPDSARQTKHLKYLKNNLDIKVLDHRGLKKVIKLFDMRYAKQADTRRVGLEAHGQNPYVKTKCLNMIRQSIHYVRERLNDTRSYRRRFKGMPGYQIAVLYGTASAIISKMESIYAQMRHLPWKTHFLWFLVIYEKLLASNIDITNIVERIYLIQDQFAVIRGPKENMPKISKKDMNKFRLPPSHQQKSL